MSSLLLFYVWLLNIGVMCHPDEKIISRGAFPHWIPRQSYTLETDSLPYDQRFWATIGNGHLATVVHSNSIYMNGLYNGYMSASHRARIPSMASYNVSLQGEVCKRIYSLNLAEGAFIETLICNNINITHHIYAHRKIKPLIVNEISISHASSAGSSKMLVEVNQGSHSNDIEMTKVDDGHYQAVTKVREAIDSELTDFHIFFNSLPSVIDIDYSVLPVRWVALTSIHVSLETARNAFKKGKELAAYGQLYSIHVEAWFDLWTKGRIDVDIGYQDLSRNIYSGLYYLLSSIPDSDDAEWPFVGISPGSLAHDDYLGHVFWDQDVWMFPPIHLFHPNLGKIILNSRQRLLNAEIHNAYKLGYKGAKYPWEVAYSGEDVTPDRNCSQYEIHVSGDIALATHLYYYTTHKIEFIPLAIKLAEFWRSILIKGKNEYFIHNVMGPDEYHFPVNNSAYTNAIAGMCLDFLDFLRTRDECVHCWSDDNYPMYIPYDRHNDYNPEYDGYSIGTEVKQADVILLQYPLRIRLPNTTLQNNLLIYEKYTNPNGPAMTLSVFTINWLEFKRFEKAQAMFQLSYKNSQKPFLIWSENLDGSGAVNFLTGIGGFLQSILFGFAGFRILPTKLLIDPVLLPGGAGYNITGIEYMNGTFDIQVYPEIMILCLDQQETLANEYFLVLPNRKVKLLKNIPSTSRRTNGFITIDSQVQSTV